MWKKEATATKAEGALYSLPELLLQRTHTHSTGWISSALESLIFSKIMFLLPYLEAHVYKILVVQKLRQENPSNFHISLCSRHRLYTR